MLCVLLFLWMGGSSYYYLCIVNDHCSRDKIVPVDAVVSDKEAALPIVEESAEEEVTGLSDIASDPIPAAEAITVIDSITIAREYFENNPTRIIYFAYAKYENELTEEDSVFIDMLRIYIKNEPGKAVYVSGHSDSIGTPEGLMFASYRRAVFMKGALVDAGIPISHITSKSLGNSSPLASDASAQGRAKNRRVEISIRNL